MSKYRIIKDYEQALMLIQDIIGANITNNEQLTRLGNLLFNSNYLGSFPSNKMPKYIKENQCFILNTDSSRSSNKFGHWVAFYKINSKLYYYDSFSRPIDKLSKLWKNRRLYNANTSDRDQSYEEKSCGSRAMAFLVLIRKYGEKCINVV